MQDRVFDNFLEYYSLTKGLQEYQKEIIFNCLSRKEQRYLARAFRTEGWEDLFIRNEIDHLVDEIEEDFGINLVSVRIKVVSNKEVHKVRKPLWQYINDAFSKYSLRHIWHLFEGVRVIEHNDGWVLLVPSERGQYGKEDSSDDQ